MADTLTANFSLVKIEPGTTGWDVKTNNNLDALDSVLLQLITMAQLTVIDKDLTAPPGAPADRDTYIIGASPTGAWTGFANRVAVWSAAASAWAVFVPADGWEAWVKDEGVGYRYNGTAWVRKGPYHGRVPISPSTGTVAGNSGFTYSWSSNSCSITHNLGTVNMTCVATAKNEVFSGVATVFDHFPAFVSVKTELNSGSATAIDFEFMIMVD